MAGKTKVLAKVSDILDCFTSEAPVWTATDLAKKLNIPVTTLHGIVADLVTLNFLEQCAYSKAYKVGLRFMEMGERFTNNFELNNIAHAIMHELAIKLNKLVGLSLLYKGWMYVSMSTVPMDATHSLKYVGPKLPAFQAAGGKIILAHLPIDQQQHYFSTFKVDASPLLHADWDNLPNELQEIKQQGYSLAWESSNKMVPFSIGAPIFGRNKQILAGLVVLSPYEELIVEELPTIIRNVTHSANEISSRCGHLSSVLLGSI